MTTVDTPRVAAPTPLPVMPLYHGLQGCCREILHTRFGDEIG